MPTYDYVCESCGRQVEVVHGIHAPRPTTCEVCGGSLRKLVSAPNIVFKGSGWAKKDARTAVGAGKSAASGESKGEGASSAGEGSRSNDAGGSSETSTTSGDAKGTGG